jgi:hypothetical protein
MIAVLGNMIDRQTFVMYDLSFYQITDNTQTQENVSLCGVIFESPYTQQDLTERVTQIFSSIYPEEIIDQIIIN